MTLAANSDIQLYLKCRTLDMAKVSKVRLTEESTILINSMILTQVFEISFAYKLGGTAQEPRQSNA